MDCCLVRSGHGGSSDLVKVMDGIITEVIERPCLPQRALSSVSIVHNFMIDNLDSHLEVLMLSRIKHDGRLKGDKGLDLSPDKIARATFEPSVIC